MATNKTKTASKRGTKAKSKSSGLKKLTNKDLKKLKGGFRSPIGPSKDPRYESNRPITLA